MTLPKRIKTYRLPQIVGYPDLGTEVDLRAICIHWPSGPTARRDISMPSAETCALCRGLS